MAKGIKDVHTKEITEGTTKLLVPDLDYYKQFAIFPSSVAPLFYNPRMEFSRDISVAMLYAHQKIIKEDLQIADPLASTGIRAIRYATEIENVEEIYMNDANPNTIEFMKENARLNKIKNYETTNLDANKFLSSKKGGTFNVIDIDPFGTPMPFIDSAARAIRKNKSLLTITATDTSALCGASKNACLRKYFAMPLHNEHMKEVGARILNAAIMKEFSQHGIAIIPVLTQSSDHYIKVFMKTSHSPALLNKQLAKMGFVFYCYDCGYHEIKEGFQPIGKACKNCKADLVSAGPLYLGELHDKEYIEKALTYVTKTELGTQKRAIKLLEIIKEEIGLPPLFYDTEKFASRRKTGPKRITHIIEALTKKKKKAVRTHFSETGIKTNATYKEFSNIIDSK